MAGLRKWKGLAAWIPLTLAVAVLASLVGVLLLGPAIQPARGAPPAPEVTAGFQTTERLTLTVNLPALDKGAQRGKLLVELVDPDGNVFDDVSKDVEPTTEAASHRFEFAAPKLVADKVTIRC